MPIRKDLRHLYRGPVWEEKRNRALKRAGNRCVSCRKPQHEWVFTYTWQTREPRLGGRRYYHMIWIREGSKVWRNQFGRPCSPLHAPGLPRKIRVKLGVGHADQNAENMDDRNLKAWCTWCHLHHDQAHHKETRCLRKDAARPVLRVAS